MTPAYPRAEQDRAIANVTQCGLRLRQAQDNVRAASELHRRALRTADTVAGELGEATRRLARLGQTPAGNG